MSPKSLSTENELIIAFDDKHEIGSICRPPCPQCRETEETAGYMTDGDGYVTIPAMLILREVTKEEWLAFCLKTGASLPVIPNGSKHFYAVTTD